MEEIAKAVLTGKPVKDLPIAEHKTTKIYVDTSEGDKTITLPEGWTIKKSLAEMVFDLGKIDAQISELDEFDQDLDFLFKAQYADIEEKCEAYHAFLKGVYYEWRDAKEEIDRLKRREKTLANMHKRVSDNLKELMQNSPEVNFQGNADKKGNRKIVFKLRKNSQKTFEFDYELKEKTVTAYVPDHVIQLDPRVEKYCTYQSIRVLSKAAIAEAIEKGVEVPFAAFKQGYYVSGIPKLKIEKEKKEEPN